MLPSDDCHDCVPNYARTSRASALLTYLLFTTTFILTAIVALRRLLPKLSPDALRSPTRDHHDVTLPLHKYELSGASSSRSRSTRFSMGLSAKRIGYLTFATNIGLSAVLVELLLCEISNALDPGARAFALDTVLPALMFLVILVAPALELQSILAASGLTFGASGKGRIRMAWFFEAILLFVWLFGFWYLGHAVLEIYLRAGSYSASSQGFVEGCLERLGVIGITFMASLSGFAAVSAVWQTFMVRHRVISDSDINRRQTGLEATEEMLESKRGRLRALERKISDVSSRGVFTTVMSTLRGTGDSKERSILILEINGLESMRMSLQDTLYLLKSRKEEQDRSHTSAGQLFVVFTYSFAAYCVIRLFSVSFSVFRRMLFSTVFLSSDSSDPVTSILSVLVKHWDPSLDQGLWTRQISFMLSGVMLIAAFNSALQTFLILGRAFPGLAISAAAFREATTLALLISQVVSTYVISAALMLRSNLPKDFGSAISHALGAPLESARVDAWFEGCFLFAAAFTAAGIWAGNRLRDSDDLDGLGGVEMGKRS
ncbi:hypothetical protein BT63DRAFT_420799 [Microthyrium microscopicum]|uniref:Abscisic acid G-protein coupled receptor-like domain-containing protein n=1 Tax=Microthyrium microscopicum TaxID=703497 RepID=A0A6A6UM96_9PEZI|nr:hypothetical protein BT63DRAFT_420799 [Microthyrium microscopicum]